MMSLEIRVGVAPTTHVIIPTVPEHSIVFVLETGYAPSPQQGSMWFSGCCFLHEVLVVICYLFDRKKWDYLSPWSHCLLVTYCTYK